MSDPTPTDQLTGMELDGCWCGHRRDAHWTWTDDGYQIRVCVSTFSLPRRPPMTDPTPLDVGIFICPVCEAVIEGDKPCPRRGLKQHGDAASQEATDD